MKILMFGKTGQVATEILRRAGDIEVEALDRAAADQANPAACAALVAKTNADVIINAAAYTAVDKAEEDEATAASGAVVGVTLFVGRLLLVASYHLSVSTVSRGRGQSAVAGAAYRAGETLHCE